MYAVVETGGKQYRVTVGQTIEVERLAVAPGEAVPLGRVLMVARDGDVQIGTPVVDGATVLARVDEHFRGEKIIVFKMRPKKRYRRKQGHRQELTRVTIQEITV